MLVRAFRACNEHRAHSHLRQAHAQIARTLERWFNTLIFKFCLCSLEARFCLWDCEDLLGKHCMLGRMGSRGRRGEIRGRLKWNTAFLLPFGNVGSSFVVTYFVLGLCFVFLFLIQLLNIGHVPGTVTSTGEAATNKVLASVKLKFWQAYLSCQYLLFSQKS